MAIAILPILFALVGALVYALSANAKAGELGKLAYFAGMLALAFALASHVVRVG